ncbi:hypothetical protein K440DRAFT_636125 [Wilcoxina mikolae CBS 423.85]|nr:hypothetical protein K440DRAFT_636125 [Wilcoxina mikolae CBS 423.85]
MAMKGGLFLPMYQREAVWISFDASKMKVPKRFAIKIFLGGVNGISGESLKGDMNSILSLMQPNPVDQDYIIIPGQMWLDGLATEPGVVRQFVATTTCPKPAGNHNAGTPPASLFDSPPTSTRRRHRQSALRHRRGLPSNIRQQGVIRSWERDFRRNASGPNENTDRVGPKDQRCSTHEESEYSGASSTEGLGRFVE